jgi:pseudouridylate synthase
MAARDAVGDTAALLIANPLPLDKQLDPALHDQVLNEALAAADGENVRGKAVTPFLLAYMQRATEGKSVEVNLDVARGNIALAAEIATAWAALATKTADARPVTGETQP